MNPVTQTLIDLVTRVPSSKEFASGDPRVRAQSVARFAAIRAAGISSALALPPGPLGLATIFPDLLAIWRVQQAMVADIAAVFGRSAFLQKEAMVFGTDAGHRRAPLGKTGQAQLEQALAVDQRRKLLGQGLPGQRPQAGAAAPAQDHGVYRCGHGDMRPVGTGSFKTLIGSSLTRRRHN